LKFNRENELILQFKVREDGKLTPKLKLQIFRGTRKPAKAILNLNFGTVLRFSKVAKSNQMKFLIEKNPGIKII
jgi:hypothetical protein